MGFNTVDLALATFGFLNPIFAAFLHHISSVFVVTNAGRYTLLILRIHSPSPYSGRWMSGPFKNQISQLLREKNRRLLNKTKQNLTKTK